ncbi:hypothetical protein ACOTDT_19145 [Achromobacter xylosoxidans]
MKPSDFNHLRRLLGWVRCDIGQDPAGQQQTMIDIAAKLGPAAIDADAKARLVEGYRRAKAVPVYVRDAVKALEKALAAGGREPGAEKARPAAETRAIVDFTPGAGGGRGPAVAPASAPDTAQDGRPTPSWLDGGADAVAMARKDGLLPGALAAAGNDEDLAAAHLAAGHPYWQGFKPAGSDDQIDLYTADQLRVAVLADRQRRADRESLAVERGESDASAAAAPLQNHPHVAAEDVACRDTPAAPPILRRDDTGGAGAARRSTPAHSVQEVQVERKAAGPAENRRSTTNPQAMQEPPCGPSPERADKDGDPETLDEILRRERERMPLRLPGDPTLPPSAKEGEAC